MSGKRTNTGYEPDPPLPYEHCDITVSARSSNRDGIISDEFGSLKVFALQGRGIAIEITEELSGLTMTAVLDEWKGSRSHFALLRSQTLMEAIESARREDGLPEPFPCPAGYPVDPRPGS